MHVLSIIPKNIDTFLKRIVEVEKKITKDCRDFHKAQNQAK